MQPHLVDDSVDVDRCLIMQLVHQCVDCDVRPGSTDSGADTHNTTATTLSVDNATLLAFAAERRLCRLHKRKLLLGPGAQAPHFYDHGLSYMTSLHFCDVISSRLCFNIVRTGFTQCRQIDG